MMSAPWESLLSQYEFMIVFASFQRNVLFYSSMDQGQLKTLYSQLVSFSPARILTIDALISGYNKGRLSKTDPSLVVPCELTRVITLVIGNRVPELFVHECISSCDWKGYDNMVLAAFASAESVRSGALKYIALIRESVRDRRSLHNIISLAVTGWTVKLSDSKCTCGTWAQAVDLLSSFVPDTETTLNVQRVDRISAYICTLLDLAPQSQGPSRLGEKQCYRSLDYGHMFSDLLVSDLDSAVTDNSPPDCRLPAPRHSTPRRRT